jgi:hypothetical protein
MITYHTSLLLGGSLAYRLRLSPCIYLDIDLGIYRAEKNIAYIEQDTLL